MREQKTYGGWRKAEYRKQITGKTILPIVFSV